MKTETQILYHRSESKKLSLDFKIYDEHKRQRRDWRMRNFDNIRGLLFDNELRKKAIDDFFQEASKSLKESNKHTAYAHISMLEGLIRETEWRLYKKRLCYITGLYYMHIADYSQVIIYCADALCDDKKSATWDQKLNVLKCQAINAMRKQIQIQSSLKN